MAGRIAPMTPIFQKGKRRRPRVMPTAPGQRRPRERDRAHLGFIGTLPCVICGRHPVDRAHVRFGDAQRGKPYTGKAEKPSDKWTVPLCHHDHQEGPDAQHRSGNERLWWERQGIDVLSLCEELYAVSGDEEAALAIIDRYRRSRKAEH